MASNNKKLLVFILIDGWGTSPGIDNNAIRKAEVSGFKNLVANYPSTIISPPNLRVGEGYEMIGLGKKDIKDDIANLSLSKIISRSNLSQLKIANSQEFPLISVFLNNSEERFLNEDWVIFDNKPDNIWSFLFHNNNLSDKIIKKIKSGRYNFIVSSLPYISQVLSDGDFARMVLAVEEVSRCLERISRAVLSVGGTLVISASYGGAEDVFNIGTGLPNKKRSTNPVPFIVVNQKYKGRVIESGEAPNNDISLLSPAGSYLDIAPTILNLLGLRVPEEMEGKSLI